jgi:hypothetical protein
LPEPNSDKDELRERLWKLPSQLLLAVINGTAVLVIVACILALVTLLKLTHIANDITSTMTDAVLSRIDVKPQQVRANLQSVTADVHELLKALKQARVEAPDQINPEVAKLNDRLSALQVSIAHLREARSSLVDEAISRIGRALSESLQNFRECKPAVLQQ